MEFEKRLQKAIQRGQQTGDAKGRERAEHALTVEELRNLHSEQRLNLSEHIEACLQKLADYLPGFRYAPVLGPEGWGASVSRDDLGQGTGGRPRSFYSRLEILIRPFSAAHIVEVVAKAAIRNKEVFNRTQYQRLAEADIEAVRDVIDAWVLEYAEVYAAQRG